MITIQRVRVRWTAVARAAPHANARRGLNCPVPLPAALPTGDTVLVHDVLADEAVGYLRRDEVRRGGVARARDVGLRLTFEDSTTVVDRLPSGAAYPRQRGSGRLFALAPGQVGRYRANFRFTGCACDPSWFYEDWVVHVSNGPVALDRFVDGGLDHDVDDRVHLYGGTARSAGRSLSAASTARPDHGSA